MAYCKECVLIKHCSDMRKNEAGNINCHKYKDSNFNDCSRDSDGNSVSEGAFGDVQVNLAEAERNAKFRNVENRL